MSASQPRERLVPCQLCGINPATKRPRRMTWAVDAICDQHAVHDDGEPCLWTFCQLPRCRAYWGTDDRTIQARD